MLLRVMLFSVLTMTKPGKYTSPCKFTWDGQELSTDDIKDGTILNLKFSIGDSARMVMNIK